MARGVDKKKRDRIMDYVQSKKRFVGQEEILRELQMDKNDIRLCFIYAKKNIPEFKYKKINGEMYLKYIGDETYRCIYPNCFDCPLPDCDNDNMHKAEKDYTRKMNKFRSFQNAAYQGADINYLMKSYPECVDNEKTVSLRQLVDSIKRNKNQ